MTQLLSDAKKEPITNWPRLMESDVAADIFLDCRICALLEPDVAANTRRLLS
jgi:hypothetical protein